MEELDDDIDGYNKIENERRLQRFLCSIESDYVSIYGLRIMNKSDKKYVIKQKHIKKH